MNLDDLRNECKVATKLGAVDNSEEVDDLLERRHVPAGAPFVLPLLLSIMTGEWRFVETDPEPPMASKPADIWRG